MPYRSNATFRSSSTRRSFLQRTLAVPLAAGAALVAQSNPQWNTYSPSGNGAGAGKRVLLISGDEEYRSEEALPQLAKILASHHGFHCTVLFAIDPKDGTINPDVRNNIPGLEALRDADLMIIATRFRELPDEQMRWVDEYVHSGRPIVGLRTATHAFAYGKESTSRYRHYSWNDKEQWPGGFGKQVLGETWISHHGHHAVQSTRGKIAAGAKAHPIVRGCEDIWGPTDVYEVKLPLPAGATPLVMGEVLTGMQPGDPPVVGEYAIERNGRRMSKTPNDPMMPVAWTKTFTGRSGKAARVFTTTMGAATDLESEGMRRLLVNATYWAVGLEAQIPERANVALVGEFQPTPFGFSKYVKGRRPADYR